MLEMQQINRTVLLLGTGWMALSDCRHRTVSVPFACFLLAGGVLLEAASGKAVLPYAAAGFMAGAGFAALSKLTDGSVGYGDALAFAVSGVYLGILRNLLLIFGSFLVCGLSVLVLMILRRKKRNEKIAFIPFILIVYVVFGCFTE